MDARCASCGATAEDIGAIGDVVTGEPREPHEGAVLVCGMCGGLNRFVEHRETVANHLGQPVEAVTLKLAQHAIDDVIKASLQDAANVLKAQTIARERMRERGAVQTFEDCTRKMCFNAARWRVGLVLRPKRAREGAFAEAMLGISVCDAHRLDNPEEFLGEEGWRQILAGFDKAGKQRPHRSSTTMIYRALDSEEVGRMESKMRELKGEAVH